MTSEIHGLPEFRDWSIAAVRLLQGVIYQEETDVWEIVLSNRSALEGFLGRLGLQLVIDETDGYAFVRQLADDELPEEYDQLPKLFRRTRLSYDATLLCVLLREELRRSEEDLHNQRCVVSLTDLFEAWKTLHAPNEDELQMRKALGTALKTLEGLKFIKRFSKEPEEWEIRRILKARLTVRDLETLRQQLLDAAARRNLGNNEAQ